MSPLYRWENKSWVIKQLSQDHATSKEWSQHSNPGCDHQVRPLSATPRWSKIIWRLEEKVIRVSPNPKWLVKWGNLDKHMHTTRKDPHNVNIIYRTRNTWDDQELGETFRTDSPSQLSEGTNPPNTLIPDFWPLELRQYICCVNHLVFGTLFWQP